MRDDIASQFSRVWRPSRRAFVQAALAGLSATHLRAQGFAGLGVDAGGFKAVAPGVPLRFPADHGAHPDFRIEWWYVTANLTDERGAACGIQWTLFRQAMQPGAQGEGWESQQIWMGHAAATNAVTHRFSEKFARGGIGQAGVEAAPFQAWIDDWQIKSSAPNAESNISPVEISASGDQFSYRLQLRTDRPLVLQGDGGYSQKSERGQASYYYSQPYFQAHGEMVIDNKPMRVSGSAWMDREWSSQPLESDQTGWDWFSLHLNTGEKCMLFRLRQKDGGNYFAGNWIGIDGRSEPLAAGSIALIPTVRNKVSERELPTRWRVEIADRQLGIDTVALNAQSWMRTSFAYWEGPIAFDGTHSGIGYLEMTGY